MNDPKLAAAMHGGGCECDWKFHEGKPCPQPPHDHGPNLRVSPALCMRCLFVCCGERDDEMDLR